MKQARTLSRYFGLYVSKLFRSRNIIVVSEGEVKHYPVSSRIQLFLLFGMMGFLSWVSYSTGSYLAAESILAEKERKIETTAIANRRMEEQFTLLKRDLVKLQDKAQDLTEYDKFVLQQHSILPDGQGADTSLDDGGLTHISQNVLQERIDYLENMVDQLQSERVTLVSSLQSRTKNQIDLYRDLIQSTGLNLPKLVKEAKTASAESSSTASAQASVPAGGYAHQGGPFIPIEGASAYRSEEEETLFQDVDEMMTLHQIVRSLPLGRPMKKASITSEYGRRRDPFTRGWAMHRGLDFVGSWNSRVAATAPGKVIYADRNGAYGYMIEVDHGLGVSTRYAHLSKVLVKEGSTVRTDQIIGIQGNTGRSTGSHLHYEVRYNGKALNPRPFVEAQNNVLTQ